MSRKSQQFFQLDSDTEESGGIIVPHKNNQFSFYHKGRIIRLHCDEVRRDYWYNYPHVTLTDDCTDLHCFLSSKNDHKLKRITSFGEQENFQHKMRRIS